MLNPIVNSASGGIDTVNKDRKIRKHRKKGKKEKQKKEENTPPKKLNLGRNGSTKAS